MVWFGLDNFKAHRTQNARSRVFAYALVTLLNLGGCRGAPETMPDHFAHIVGGRGFRCDQFARRAIERYGLVFEREGLGPFGGREFRCSLI